MDTDLYFTMALAVLDLTTGQLRFAQGGHPHPVLQTAQGQIKFLGGGRMPLGLLPHATYELCHLQLRTGDQFYILSDGVSECPDKNGTLLDDAGTEKLLLSLDTAKGLDKLDLLVWKLADHASTTEFPDDVSAVLLEFGANDIHSAS